jgi:hypothetical protein
VQLIAGKKKRNRLVPLLALPNEILGRILLNTQTSPSSQTRNTARYTLWDFAYNDDWEKVILTCTHIYEISLSTPELWAQIDFAWAQHRVNKYLSHAGAVELTIQWGTTAIFGRRDKMELTSACTSLMRSRAAKLSPGGMKSDDVAAISRIQIPAHPRLLVLHLDLHLDDEAFLETLKLFTGLVELSVTNTTLNRSLDISFPFLMRLHLHNIFTDSVCTPVIRLLQRTPRLKEFLMESISYLGSENVGADLNLARHNLELPDLRRVVLVTRPRIIYNFLRILSPHMSRVQDIIIETVVPAVNPAADFRLVAQLVEEITARWKEISTLPMPPACLVWDTISNWFRLSIHTAQEDTPHLGIDISFSDDLNWLSQQRNLNIDSIQITGLHPDHFLPRAWTTYLAKKISKHTPVDSRLKKLSLKKCHHGVPGLGNWIRTQRMYGHTIQQVSFEDCEHGLTWKDYEELKDSNIVSVVEWTG